ncbi:MAG: hypothetical protein ACI9AO_001034 [Ilumatobacter sp.]|jgi:hypothetical protein
MKVDAFLDQWLASQQGRLRASTHHSYGVTSKRIRSGLGHVQVQALTPLQIETFYSELLDHGRADGTGLSPKKVRNTHTVLRKALSDAERLGIVYRNAAAAARCSGCGGKTSTSTLVSWQSCRPSRTGRTGATRATWPLPTRSASRFGRSGFRRSSVGWLQLLASLAFVCMMFATPTRRWPRKLACTRRSCQNGWAIRRSRSRLTCIHTSRPAWPGAPPISFQRRSAVTNDLVSGHVAERVSSHVDVIQNCRTQYVGSAFTPTVTCLA